MFLTWLKKSGIEDGAPSLLTGTEGAGSGQSSEPCTVLSAAGTDSVTTSCHHLPRVDKPGQPGTGNAMTAENTAARDTSRAAVVQDKPGAMPLGARRLVMIGGLCVPVGLVAGPYLLGAQLLAVAGVIMVAAAVSYRVQAPWFSRLSWVVVGAGALWLGGTAAYWGAIIAAAASSAEGPTFIPLLFTAGTVSFVIMAGAAVSAVVLRMVRSRRNTVSMV